MAVAARLWTVSGEGGGRTESAAGTAVPREEVIAELWATSP